MGRRGANQQGWCPEVERLKAWRVAVRLWCHSVVQTPPRVVPGFIVGAQETPCTPTPPTPPTRCCRARAALLEQADALIVAAGAGMGVDSGLPDFRGNEGFWRAYPALAQARLDFASIA